MVKATLASSAALCTGKARRPRAHGAFGGRSCGNCRLLSPLLVLALLFLRGTAWAQASRSDTGLSATSVSPTPPTVAGTSHWYGWETLVVDALPVGLFTYYGFGQHRRSVGLLWAIAALYSFPGPIIHASHKNYGRAGLALAIRTLAATLTTALLSSEECFSRGSDGGGCERTSGSLFVLGSTAVDAALLAHERLPSQPRSGLWIAPMGKGLAVGGSW
jgi:hypothetical protein